MSVSSLPGTSGLAASNCATGSSTRRSRTSAHRAELTSCSRLRTTGRSSAARRQYVAR
jgi:hypothetical protein